ncbi:MAG: hypothetical protein QM655_13655 [Nocardioidaceae bacterium]
MNESGPHEDPREASPDLPAEPSPDLSAGQDAEIRRLLADAADPTPLPDAVGARLDDTLADLVASGVPYAAPASPRRRRWPAVLAGAAAVTVFGYAGLGILTGSPDLMSGGGSADSADSATTAGQAPRAAAGDDSGDARSSDTQSGNAAAKDGPEASGSKAEPSPNPEKSPYQAHDFSALLGLDSGALTLLEDGIDSQAELGARNGPQGRCAPARGDYLWTRVTMLDGTRTRLVARPTQGAVTLEAWPCTYAFVPLATVLLGH